MLLIQLKFVLKRLRADANSSIPSFLGAILEATENVMGIPPNELLMTSM